MKKNIKACFYRYIECGIYAFLTPLRVALELVMERISVMFFYRVVGSSYGDTLAISAVISEFARQKPIKAVVFSKIPMLFIANPNVILNVNYNALPKLVRSLLKTFSKYFRGKQIISVGQERWVIGSNPCEEYKIDRNSVRYLSSMIPDCLNNGFIIPADVTPEIYFEKQEIEQYEEKYSCFPDKYSVIKSSVGKCRIPAMMLKEWGSLKMDAVASHSSLKALHWVQIGEGGEPRISGAIDMTGIPIREALFIMSRSQFVLTTEGFISHAAAALDIPAVVVFSGRTDPKTFVYPSTIPVVAEELPECSPCEADYCRLSEKVCTERITVQQVVDTIMYNFNL